MKCVAVVVLTQVSVPAALPAMPPTPTTAAIPTSLHSSGSILSPRRLGLAVVNQRSMPEASASPPAIATLIVPSLVRVVMVFIRTTVDRR